MKKTISALLLIAILICFSGCGSGKDPGSDSKEAAVNLLLTISTKGELQLTEQQISVPDQDKDGSVSLDEVLSAAHKQFYKGSDEGYASADGGYGLAITSLWGDANGMSGYGYCINNVPAMNLAATAKNGDNIYVYSYKDLTNWSDAYCWFENVKQDGANFSVTLIKSGFDEAWNPISVPAANCSIICGGNVLSVTDENGNASFSIDPKTDAIISAEDPNGVLVPPVLIYKAK